MLQLVGSNVQNQSNYIRQIQTLSRIISKIQTKRECYVKVYANSDKK